MILITLTRSQITNAPEFGVQNLRDKIKPHKRRVFLNDHNL